ncbi:MAG TPA: O-antigen ligase family protein, partial [Dehalococcoidia bacterium]|nr:O-antigen ligase family protein [Dehalococcoidia bacterium]
FFFTIINVLRSHQEVEAAARAVVLGAGAAGALALALYLLPARTSLRMLTSLGWLGYPTGDGVLRYIADSAVLRAVGTAIDPNLLGGMLMIALPLLAGQLVDRRPILLRVLLGALLLTAAAALLLSYSRSAWLGALVGLLALGVFRYRKLLLYGGLALVLLMVVPQGGAFVERFRSGVVFADRAAQMRLGEYNDALNLVAQYPAFGVGFGEAPKLDLYVAASSIYLLAAEQMGLIGLAGFIFVLGVFFWTAFRRRDVAEARGLGGIQIGALAGVLGAASAGLFDHYFFNLQFPHTVALFWLFVGLATAATSEGDPGAAPKAAA